MGDFKKDVCKSCDLYNNCYKGRMCSFSNWLYNKMPRLWKFIKNL